LSGYIQSSKPTILSHLAHILDPASVQQIGKMHYERALLPNDLDERSLNVLLHFDAGTSRKCGRTGGTHWDGHDRLS